MSEATGAGGSIGGAPATPSTLERETDIIQQKFDELRALQATARHHYFALAVAVIILFAIFMFATYRRINQNFNQEAVQNAFSAEMPELMSQAGSQLMKAGYAAVPAYRDALMAKMSTAGPELAAQTQARMEQVPETAGKALQAKLQESFGHVLDRIKPEISKSYPSLSDEKKQDLMTVAFHDAVIKETGDLSDHVQAQYIGEMAKFDDLLKKFDLPEITDKDQKEAYSREFLHNVILLIDMNVMQGDVVKEQPTRTAALSPQ